MDKKVKVIKMDEKKSVGVCAICQEKIKGKESFIFTYDTMNMKKPQTSYKKQTKVCSNPNCYDQAALRASSDQKDINEVKKDLAAQKAAKNKKKK